MKNLFLVIALFGLVGVLFTGCKKEETTVTVPAAPSAPVAPAAPAMPSTNAPAQ